VTYVMPVLNEADHLEEAVRAILDQRYSGASELVLALGPSTDDTDAVADRLAAEDARVRLVRVPEANIPLGLNLAIAAARHDVIVRVDAHSTLPPDYTATMVAALERTSAAVVGGLMDAQGKTPFGEAVARAYKSPFGLGGGAHHDSDVEGPAESAYLGVFRRGVLEEFGGYDETLRRCEDWELASRLRTSGRLVWLVPSVKVVYYPRETVDKLWSQMFATGVWRGELVRRQGTTPLRYLAPPILVCALALSPVAALGLARRPAGVVRAGLACVASAPVVYAVGLAAASSRLGGASWGDHARNVVAMAVTHVSWGAGFVRGFVRGAEGILDRSRVTQPSR